MEKNANMYVDNDNNNDNNFLNIYICDGLKYIDVDTFNKVCYGVFIQDYKKINDIIHNFKFINGDLYYKVINEKIKVILSKHNMQLRVIELKRVENFGNSDDKFVEYLDKYKINNSIYKDMNTTEELLNSDSKIIKF